MIISLTNKISFGIGEFFSTIFLITFFLAICTFLYKASKNKRYEKFKSIFFWLSIILILHIVIFPVIYTLMLKNNPASFEFKDLIHNNEKQLALTGLTNDLKNIPSEINYFESIKISNDTIFNAPLKQLQRLTFSKNFITHASFYYNGPPGNLVAAIYIFDKKGTLKKTLYKSSKNHDELYAMKFTDLINEKINYLKSDLQYYKSKKTKIDKNNFWTFATLLPYSTSSIFTGNMSPVSPMANIFYTIHYFLVCCIGIGIFTHFIIKNIRS